MHGYNITLQVQDPINLLFRMYQYYRAASLRSYILENIYIESLLCLYKFVMVFGVIDVSTGLNVFIPQLSTDHYIGLILIILEARVYLTNVPRGRSPSPARRSSSPNRLRNSSSKYTCIVIKKL